MTTLAQQLRGSKGEVCALIAARGVPAEDAARELDALVSALESKGTEVIGTAVDRRLVGETVLDWVERREIEVTARDFRIVHGWVLDGVTAHVAELTRAREVARRTEERLRFILPHARIVVGEIDRELVFRWFHDPQQIPDGAAMIGRDIRELGKPEFAAQLAQIVERVIRTGVGERAELSLSVEGTPEHILASFEPMRDGEGSISGVLVASTDITELKRAEIALAQAGAFREQMLAVLAHDLTNPLSSVLALARLHARNEEVQPQVRRALSQIDLASQRMLELIGTLLDFSVARFGETLPITRVESDLCEVARVVVDELRSSAPERTIDIRAEGETRGVWDPARMAQIVSNLVGNALTHGASNEPVAVDIVGKGDRTLLRVSNRGPTIAAEAMPLLFEPFRRGGDPSARPRGLGLGLYIVQRLVDAHGGTIRVESTLERGTIFVVDLPRGP